MPLELNANWLGLWWILFMCRTRVDDSKKSQYLNLPSETGRCSDTEYCDWYTGHSRKCQPLREVGQDTGEGQVGCGDNGTMATRCKSKWACEGKCS